MIIIIFLLVYIIAWAVAYEFMALIHVLAFKSAIVLGVLALIFVGYLAMNGQI